ncbi:MAG: hypothetical protein ACI4S9_05835, partial [Christensenellales bacterium]
KKIFPGKYFYTLNKNVFGEGYISNDRKVEDAERHCNQTETETARRLAIKTGAVTEFIFMP